MDDTKQTAAEARRMGDYGPGAVVISIDDCVPIGASSARLSLRESLEAYAARLGVRAHDARAAWRREGLRLLGVPAYVPCSRCGGGQVDGAAIGGPSDCYVCQVDGEGTGRVAADVTSGLCAIAPGVAVPTATVDWPDDGPPAFEVVRP